MRRDDLQAQLDRVAHAPSSQAPPEFLRAVTRRRWARRLPAISAAAIVVAGAWVVSLVTHEPAVAPSPLPGPVVTSPALPPLAGVSLAVLRRDGLAAEGLDLPAEPRTARIGPAIPTERPLRAFEVSRVLHGF